jgi:hypothetical protein
MIINSFIHGISFRPQKYQFHLISVPGRPSLQTPPVILLKLLMQKNLTNPPKWPIPYIFQNFPNPTATKLTFTTPPPPYIPQKLSNMRQKIPRKIKQT